MCSNLDDWWTWNTKGTKGAAAWAVGSMGIPVTISAVATIGIIKYVKIWFIIVIPILSLFLKIPFSFQKTSRAREQLQQT